MEFVAGVAVNVVADGVSSVLSSLCKEDKTTKYKESLDYSVCLARAIALYLSKAPTIENEYLKKWYSDLIVAADEGETALRSSKTNTKKLKRATRKLEILTSKASMYFMLLELEKKAVAFCGNAAFMSTLVPGVYNAVVDAFAPMLMMPLPFVEPKSTSDDPNRHSLFDFCKSETKEALSSAAAAADDNPEASPVIGPRPASDDSVLPHRHDGQFSSSPLRRIITGGRFRYYSKKERETPNVMSSELKQFSKSITGGISKKRRGFIKNKEALTSMGLYPEGTRFPSDTRGERICKEPQKNLYDGTNMGLLDNGEHSISDKQTGYGKANMPGMSCFPSSSSGGAGNHINPSSHGLPEENDGYLSRSRTSDELNGYGNASMPAMSCFPSSSSGGAGNRINLPSSDGLPEENNGCVRDVSKIL